VAAGGVPGRSPVARIYFIPTLVAFERRHHHPGAIFVLNLLLGWTLVGWIGALIWACMNPGTAK
jgi:uncharacterized membrane protein YqaE (UPF0057 family)